MSNRSQFPKGAKRPTNTVTQAGGLAQIGQVLSKAAAQARANREAQMGDAPEQFESDIPEPVGALPLPVSQVVFDDRFEWVWEPVVEEVHVYAVMERVDESWSTRLNCVDPSMQLTPDEAKSVGEALLSAWQYQYVWKDNFADLFVNKTLEVKPLYTDQYKKPAKKTSRKATPPLRTVEPTEDPKDEA